MHIVLYSNQAGKTYHRLNQAVLPMDMETSMEVYNDLERFCQRFRTIAICPDVIILMPNSGHELETLLMSRHLFENSRIIVVLPERGKEMLAKGHKFHPRFIAYEDDDFGEVVAILKHINNKLLGKIPSYCVN